MLNEFFIRNYYLDNLCKTDLFSFIMSAIFFLVEDLLFHQKIFLIKKFNFEGQSVVPEQEDKVEETEPAF